MKITLKNNLYYYLYTGHILCKLFFRDLNLMPSNYLFAEDMLISSDPNFTYSICYWNDIIKKLELSLISFQSVTDNDIATLSGGLNYCSNNSLE